jgi:polyisoprenoid-binding protein YceI
VSTIASPTQAAKLGAGTWVIDTAHSLIEFSARHFEIAYVKGRFNKFSGAVKVDEKDPLKSTVELTVDATSVDSQAVGKREELIRGEEMLGTDAYPTITFRSTTIAQTDLTHFLVTGDLTMRGITKQVQVPVEFGGVVETPMGIRAGFSGTLTIKRSDFGVPFNREFQPGRPIVGDEVKVELQIEVAPPRE